MIRRRMLKQIEKSFFSRKYFLIAIFFFGLLIRLAYISTLEEKWYFYDTRHYEKAAVSLLQTGTFGEGYLFDETGGMTYSLEPIYPIFLASVYAVFGHSFLAVRIVQSVLGAFLLLMIFWIAEEVYPDKHIPRIAALLGAVYPYLVFVSGLLYVTLLFTVVLSLLVYVILRFHAKPSMLKAALIGLLIGLSIFCRPIIVFFVPLWILWEIIYRKESLPKLSGHVIVAGIVFLVVIFPWELRNYKIFHRITPIRAYKGEVNRLDKQFQQAELKLGNFGGDVLSAEIRPDSSENRFSIYYNGIYKGDLVDSLKLIHLEKYYAGIYLRGNQKNAVSSFKAWRIALSDTFRCEENFSKNLEQQKWYLTPTMHLTGKELIADTTKQWGNFAICRSIENPTKISMTWGKNVDGYGVEEGGLFFMTDCIGDSANGYYIVRKPTGHLSLWLIENGLPKKGLQYKAELNSPFNQRGLITKLVKLAIKTPKAFFISYFSEFLKFWSPIITESIDSKNAFNSGTVKKIGELAYGIILLFGLLALLRVPKEANPDKILLLFVVILSFAIGYSIFGVRTRYRIPSDPYLIILSASGVVIFVKNVLKLRGAEKNE